LKVSKEKLNKGRTLNMSKKGDDPRKFVIIGGGPAGLSAAETLR
jgi:NADPH-dependent 2,4-dienoyl-CoA reductase/sulfur reductase-like enzyme